jgi:hypothetical protein
MSDCLSLEATVSRTIRSLVALEQKSHQASVSCQESASTAGGWPKLAKTWGDRAFLVELM